MGMMVQIWIPYCGAAPLPGDWLARWNGDPILLLAFAAVALVAWQRMEVAASFWAGLAILVLLFVSPLCALSSARSEEHTSELQSLMRISYAVFCLKKKKKKKRTTEGIRD